MENGHSLQLSVHRLAHPAKKILKILLHQILSACENERFFCLNYV